ncbi:SMI1/KNR4 family protein [Streptomyces sp. MJP52]|uniref:SMI1/KNR4 family protein n=1 Tax=Streptomyces sp. MJP52 TaxID=2940555 RepID=UPI0024757DD2|nr:SMI1/KNR4 family protein [Streptomyces sp. MJP52]MDH6229244.1 cell wall assembly regulator SMI1 [Streptomyces sp. MJP52]
MGAVESWSRVMDLLREHAPADYADLPGPATEEMLAAAEERMGVPLPPELRAWLLRNNLDLPGEDVDAMLRDGTFHEPRPVRAA